MKNNWKFINLQNLGPIWKLLCAALKSSMNRKFGYKIYYKCNHLLMYFLSDSNIRKRTKSTRHEKEKAYIEQLQSAGATVGQYVGNGMDETETVFEQ